MRDPLGDTRVPAKRFRLGGTLREREQLALLVRHVAHALNVSTRVGLQTATQQVQFLAPHRPLSIPPLGPAVTVCHPRAATGSGSRYCVPASFTHSARTHVAPVAGRDFAPHGDMRTLFRKHDSTLIAWP